MNIVESPIKKLATEFFREGRQPEACRLAFNNFYGFMLHLRQNLVSQIKVTMSFVLEKPELKTRQKLIFSERSSV